MAILPGYNPQNLSDVLGQQAQSQSANLTDQYTQARKQAVADQASSGRLMSGVSNYPLTDLQTQYTQGLSGIQGNLSDALLGIPSQDYLEQQQFNNSYNLAGQIGQANKPSTLDQVFQGIGATSGPLMAFAALA